MRPSPILLSSSSSFNEMVFGLVLGVVLAGRAGFTFLEPLCLPPFAGSGGTGPDDLRFSLTLVVRVPPRREARNASASEALLALLPTKSFRWNQLMMGLLDLRGNFF